jgi:DNA polymerase-1
MKTRTLLVDSSYLLKRSINGAKNVYTNKFGHIGGLYGFLTMVRKLVREHNINKVILAWDGENGGYYRYLIDPAYKANRKNKSFHEKIELTPFEQKREEEKERSVLKQKKRIQTYAEELFIRQIEADKVEADDLIASYVKDNSDNEDIFLYTNDRDFSQLLNHNFTILFNNVDEPIDKHNFFIKFGYHYTNSLPMKVICGDSADNISGVGGIKEQSLLDLCDNLKVKHVSVREICEVADKLNKERVENKKKPLKKWENLLNNIPRLKMNHKLINLDKPYLDENAYEELYQLEMPLSPKGRGSKNLIKFMREDEFLSVYGGTFVDYVQPFYSVITHEKKIYDNYMKKG